MSLQRIVLNSPLSVDGFKSVCDLSPGKLPALQNLTNYLESVPDQQPALLDIQVGAVQASATLTVSAGGSSNGQIGTLLNANLTAMTSGANPALGQFNISATAATQAASMVLAIEGVLGSQVTVSRNGAVITILAKVPGALGNGLQIAAGNLANVAAGAFAGGSDGTSYQLDLR